MIANLLVDLLLMILRIFVVTVVLPTYIVFICCAKVWLERGNIYNYFVGKFK
jgi:hypothetical protein